MSNQIIILWLKKFNKFLFFLDILYSYMNLYHNEQFPNYLLKHKIFSNMKKYTSILTYFGCIAFMSSTIRWMYTVVRHLLEAWAWAIATNWRSARENFDPWLAVVLSRMWLGVESRFRARNGTKYKKNKLHMDFVCVKVSKFRCISFVLGWEFFVWCGFPLRFLKYLSCVNFSGNCLWL